MDLFGLVQTAVDLAKAHEENGEEVKFFRLKLSSLQEQLQKLEQKDFQINVQLQGQIKKELTESSQLLSKLPERNSYINTILSKLPFGSVYNDIKDKSQALDRLSQQLNNHLITSLALAQTSTVEKQKNVTTHVEETQIDDDQIVQSNQSQGKIQLKLIAEDHIKQQFRMNIINTIEVIELQFTNNESNELEVFKFGREYYRKLQMEVQQVQTISRDHATITCIRKQKQKFDSDNFEVPQKKIKIDKPTEQHQPQQQEIFYTCIDNSQQQEEAKPGDENNNYEYIFKLQNKSPNGIFIYRDEEQTKNNDEIILGTWTRIVNNKTIVLKSKDKIAILMKKPEYKQPLIAYEFIMLL
ncbi:unnamed protein product (macronuclear) [Paramecium tetraurelia]|uniref:FHA domain-containing protein n=1 Tax=Paramecium tetraurelia TaxID=5888 RepID=A0DT98_PARTE|nr:uncharacterized protein GSPATT00019958001 [Paramecium tetraurelia]CAK86265.1 unnamed protein product [Paramecium tetraurelia]|eukprot:XP_001453662.1 hypothetical protein (macronuclear) [Paramecium tetraurelia strain d4-2]